jgi:hypothetical protein
VAVLQTDKAKAKKAKKKKAKKKKVDDLKRKQADEAKASKAAAEQTAASTAEQGVGTSAADLPIANGPNPEVCERCLVHWLRVSFRTEPSVEQRNRFKFKLVLQFQLTNCSNKLFMKVIPFLNVGKC